MKELLRQRAAELSQLAATLRTGLARAEAMIPDINKELDSLAAFGVTEFQVEGPTIYVRPAGVSSARDDSFIIYQAAIVMPGGIGAAIWDASEHTEYVNAPYGEPIDLAPRFVPFANCPAIIKAMLVS